MPPPPHPPRCDSVSLDLEKAMGRFITAHAYIDTPLFEDEGCHHKNNNNHKSSSPSLKHRSFFLHDIDYSDGPLQNHHVQRLVHFWTRHGITDLACVCVQWGTTERTEPEDNGLSTTTSTDVLCQYLSSSSPPPPPSSSSSVPLLRNVRFLACRWNDGETHQVAQALAAHGNLREIVLTGESIRGAADDWNAVLTGNADLRRLEIGGHTGSVPGFSTSTQSLAEGIHHSSASSSCRLTHLSVYRCCLEAGAARPLLDALATSGVANQLTHLDLHGNHLTRSTLPALTQLLWRGRLFTEGGDHGLQVLDLSDNAQLFVHAPTHHVQDLAHALRHNVHLRSLLLRNCGLSPVMLAHLSEAAVTNTTLRHLDVQQMSFDTTLVEGFPLTFWDALARWENIQRLDLDVSNVIDTGRNDQYWKLALWRNSSLVEGEWFSPKKSTQAFRLVDSVFRRNLAWQRGRCLLAETSDGSGVWAAALEHLVDHPTAAFCCLRERLAGWRQATGCQAIENKDDKGDSR